MCSPFLTELPTCFSQGNDLHVAAMQGDRLEVQRLLELHPEWCQSRFTCQALLCLGRMGCWWRLVGWLGVGGVSGFGEVFLKLRVEVGRIIRCTNGP